MKVDVFSYKQRTYGSAHALQRHDDEEMSNYIIRNIDEHINILRTELSKVSRNRISEYAFFCLPEFYWNVPWKTVKDDDELGELFFTYATDLTKKLDALVSEFPAQSHGRLIFLGGSVATLIKIEEGGGYYEALNYSLVLNNFRENQEGANEIQMWPKRFTSKIDFGDKIGEDNTHWYFRLSALMIVKVSKESIAVSEHNTSGGFGPVLDNTWIDDSPFSINLCVDYRQLYPGERDDELKESRSKIDFLMACGMPFANYHRYPLSTQYAVRNDGYPNIGGIEVRTILEGKLADKLPHINRWDKLYQWLVDIQ